MNLVSLVMHIQNDHFRATIGWFYDGNLREKMIIDDDFHLQLIGLELCFVYGA